MSDVYAVYVHIPYCRKRCTYCDFHFSTQVRHKRNLIEALVQEIALRKNELASHGKIKTLYFGGGTPSLLDTREWEMIFAQLRACIEHFDDIIETTIEVNPEDINEENLALWRALGINRLSIGVQSLHDETLVWMNRVHKAKNAVQAILQAQSVGFDNISVDYIMGVPHLALHQMEQEINTLISLGVQHISAYILTIEQKTSLYHQIKTGQLPRPKDEHSTEQFIALHHLLTNAGFEHYEISNYAKPKFQSQHNSSYWTGQAYIGLGPSASSLDKHYIRRKNIANNILYIQSIQQHQVVPYETEMLTPQEKYNEYIMLGLRTKRGISLPYMLEHCPDSAHTLTTQLEQYVQRKWLQENNAHFSCTLEGWLFSDQMSSALFA